MDKKRDFKSVISIDISELNEELRVYPELRYEQGLKIEKVQRKINSLKNQLEVKENRLYLMGRNKTKRSKDVKLTETEIKAQVKSNAEIVEIKQEIERWEKVLRLAWLKYNTLQDKMKSMEIIGNNIRADKKTK